MVVVLRSIAKSFEQQLLKQSKHYSSSQLITHLSSFNSNSQVQQWQFQNRRTLILEPVTSQSIKLEQLSDSDSGILELKLDRPDRKNAIGKAMLRELSMLVSKRCLASQMIPWHRLEATFEAPSNAS